MAEQTFLPDDHGFVKVPQIETGDLVLGGSPGTPINSRLSFLKSRDRFIVNRQNDILDRVEALEASSSAVDTALDNHNSRLAMCRLSLSTQVPYSGDELTGIYRVNLHRYEGRLLSVWSADENKWVPTEIPSPDDGLLGVDLTGQAPNGNYDIFASLQPSGALQLHATRWPDSSAGVNSSTLWETRLAWNNSVPVDSNLRRYLGSVRLTDTGIHDNSTSRLVSNYYNQQPVNLKLVSNNVHRYVSATWRVYDGSIANRFDVLFAKSPNHVQIEVQGFAGIAATAFHNIGVNSTTQGSAIFLHSSSVAFNNLLPSSAAYVNSIGSGFYQFYPLQRVSIINSGVTDHATFSDMTMRAKIYA